MASYLASITSGESLSQQQQLAAAYDKACHALIGPNDVQKDGNREFKKKSAWRKLARHFGISVECELADSRIESTPDGFIAYARARAVAPWGQSWADVAACSSDEATGRRVITIADAIATAMTRASNRAVSNLIAMGEVSAEEIGSRKSYGGESRNGSPKNDAEKVMPFGRNKGTKLGEIVTEDLESALKWCREKGKTDLAEAIGNVLANRALDPSESDDSEWDNVETEDA
jgi:hypothetical protein